MQFLDCKYCLGIIQSFMSLLWEQKEPKILGIYRFSKLCIAKCLRVVNSLRSDKQRDVKCPVQTLARKAKKPLKIPNPKSILL